MTTTKKALTIDELCSNERLATFALFTADQKADIVANLAEIEAAWKAEAVRVRAAVEALEAGVTTLQAFHTQVVGLLQITRKDCGDLKKLDGRTLKGATAPEST